MQALALRGQRLLQGGDLVQAGGGLQGNASGPTVFDVLGDQAGFAGAALGTGEVVQHQFFDDRQSHDRFPLAVIPRAGYRPPGRQL